MTYGSVQTTEPTSDNSIDIQGLDDPEDKTISMRRRHTFFGNLFYRMYKQGRQAIIHAVMELEHDVDDEKLAKVLEEKVLIYPRFSCTLDDEHWIPVDFKAIDMISHEHLPGVNPQLELEAFIGTVMLRDFLPDRPHWEVIKVHYEGHTRVDLLWRISHCIGDGVTLSTVLVSVTDAAPGSELKPVSRRPKKGMTLQRGLLLLLGAAVALAVPLVFALAGVDAFDDLGNTAKTWIIVAWCVLVLVAWGPSRDFLVAADKVNRLTVGPSDSGSVLHGAKPKYTGDKVVASLPPISVSELKRVAKAQGCTLNDVVMSMVSGGLRRYLLSKNDPAMQRCLPLRFRSLSIVNVRAMGKTPEMILGEYLKGGSGNEISYFSIPLDLGDKPAQQRLQRMNKVMTFVKRSPEGWITLMGNKGLGRLLGMRFLEWLGSLAVAKCTTMVSNLPGPSSVRVIAGAEIKRLYNCVAPMGMAITFSLLSYNGDITVCSSGDKDMLGGTPAEVLACVLEEYNALQAELSTSVV